jgi:hypothetical protein
LVVAGEVLFFGSVTILQYVSAVYDKPVGPYIVICGLKGPVGLAGPKWESEGSLFVECCDYLLSQGDPIGCMP